MAVGFPVKDDYATGDVLTAANMNDLSGTLNTVGVVPSASNPVLNSAMNIWQRGTSFAVASGSAVNYTADRWAGYRNATGATVSRQTTNDTTNLPFVQYCARVQRDNSNSSTSLIDFLQMFETVNTIPFAGKTVTLSFYGRKGANYSSASDALTFRIVTGTGTDQNILATGYTGSATALTSTATLTTTWQRFSASGTISATATEMSTEFFFTPVGTAGAADFFEITGVQIDVGSVALPYRRNNVTIQGELAACQRYFQVLGGNIANENMGAGAVFSTTQAAAHLEWKVPFRAAPTIALGTGGAVGDFAVFNATGSSLTVTGLSSTAISINSARTIPVVASGLVAGSATNFVSANSNGRYFVSAEL
jgi:hypothetical protein